MQPYFFPYIGYFQLIHAVDRFFLYDNLDYSTGGWMSRNRILVVGGEPTFLSVPINDAKSPGLSATPSWSRVFAGDVICSARSSATTRRVPYFREARLELSAMASRSRLQAQSGLS